MSFSSTGEPHLCRLDDGGDVDRLKAENEQNKSNIVSPLVEVVFGERNELVALLCEYQSEHGCEVRTWNWLLPGMSAIARQSIVDDRELITMIKSMMTVGLRASGTETDEAGFVREKAGLLVAERNGNHG